LQQKIDELQDSDTQDYNDDIENLYIQIDDLQTQLDDILMEVDDMLTEWEEGQEDQSDGNSNSNSDVVLDEATRWDLDVWTDYESFDLLDAELDNKKIEDEDDYTIWLVFRNTNHIDINAEGLESARPASPAVNYLYYATDTNKLYKYTTSWAQIDFSSIYTEVPIKEITIQFNAKSGDRVMVDESKTELYSAGYPSFDWDLDFSTRSDGTCKRIEAVTEDRYTLPVPDQFYGGDPEKPYPVEFKLDFSLFYE